MASTGTYIGVLVVVAAGLFALYLMLSNVTSKTGTQNANTTAQGPTTSTANLVSSTTTVYRNRTYQCESTNTVLSIGNGNFTNPTENHFFGWSTSGGGFRVINLTSANQEGDYYVNKWSGYGNNIFAATTYRQPGPPVPGTLELDYIPVLPYLDFQIYSPASPRLYVAVISANGHEAIIHYNTLNGTGTNTTDAFASASLNMTSLMCQGVTIDIVSNVSQTQSSFGIVSSNQNLFIAVTGFYQSMYTPSTTRGIVANIS
ncbi:MAG: hypothetical protein M1321_02875 [Candidatus Marsarchaeota archaeon]|nr:hypothetical protein [Candidatus Marsarchaeota archaeon]